MSLLFVVHVFITFGIFLGFVVILLRLLQLSWQMHWSAVVSTTATLYSLAFGSAISKNFKLSKTLYVVLLPVLPALLVSLLLVKSYTGFQSNIEFRLKLICLPSKHSTFFLLHISKLTLNHIPQTTTLGAAIQNSMS